MPGRRRNGKGANGPKPNPNGRPRGQAGKAKPRRRANGNRGEKRAGAGRPKSAASAYATGLSTGVARIARNRVDECRIVHRELIASIDGTAAFTIANAFALNPGISATFPWLSVEAQGWERYRFNKLAFRYYTRTGTGTAGSMMFAPDYDAADPAPTTEQQASSYKDCQEDAPWKDINCVLTPKSLLGGLTSKYIRQGPLTGEETDIKSYDSGNMYVCSVDGVDSTHWGKLWVEYDVSLMTPQLQNAAGATNPTLRFDSGGTISLTSPFGDAPVIDGNNTSIVAVGGMLTFPVPGGYIIEMFVVGTVIASSPTVTGTATAVEYAGNINGAATVQIVSYIIDVTAPGQTVIFNWTGHATTVTSVNAIVTAGVYSILNS